MKKVTLQVNTNGKTAAVTSDGHPSEPNDFFICKQDKIQPQDQYIKLIFTQKNPSDSEMLCLSKMFIEPKIFKLEVGFCYVFLANNFNISGNVVLCAILQTVVCHNILLNV